jgi:very-short-patch-repair endonuclease
VARDITIHPAIRGRSDTSKSERRISALAEGQKGVVARRQLRAHGFSSSAIDRRIEAGRLHVLHPGVYAVGHRVVPREGRWMAAILASGVGTVLSHRSAAALWRLRPGGPLVEVTVPSRRGRANGILRHTSSLMPFDEVTEHDGIPVTTVPRTLLDLAAVLRPRDVERAINEAEVLRLGDALSLPELVERYPGRRGVAKLRRILGDLDAGSAITKEELEARFREFVGEYDLERPSFNVVVSSYVLDAVWWDHRLAVELDGHATHSTRARFESDRARDRELQVMGWRVVRVTWRQLTREPERVARDLRALLAVR